MARQVFSIETEREKDLQTLGRAVAECEYRKQRRRCRPSECAACRTKAELDACMAQLPACDALRVEHIAMDWYSVLTYSYGSRKSIGRKALEAGGTALYGIGVLALCLAGGIGFGALMFWLCIFAV